MMQNRPDRISAYSKQIEINKFFILAYFVQTLGIHFGLIHFGSD